MIPHAEIISPLCLSVAPNGSERHSAHQHHHPAYLKRLRDTEGAQRA